MPHPRVPSHPFVLRTLVAAGAVLLGLPFVAAGCSGDTPAGGPRDDAARADVEALASIPQHPHNADASCCRRSWSSFCVSLAGIMCGGTCN